MPAKKKLKDISKNKGVVKTRKRLTKKQDTEQDQRIKYRNTKKPLNQAVGVIFKGLYDSTKMRQRQDAEKEFLAAVNKARGRKKPVTKKKSKENSKPRRKRDPR